MRSICTMFMVSLIIYVCVCQPGGKGGGGKGAGGDSSEGIIETETLSIKQINDDGFGDIMNQYAFAMTEFKGSLYVGTLNAANGLLGLALFFAGLPFKTNGTQIHKGNINDDGTWQWQPVVMDGNGNPENYGIRKLKTVGEYMYGVTCNHMSGFELWRSYDGENFEVVEKDGFGDEDNTSGRGLLAFDGYLYVGAENRKTAAKIYRRAIQENGDFEDGSEWEQVVDDGLGDAGNIWFCDFVEYKGWFYAGTLNYKGMQLWRSKNPESADEFEMVFDQGNGSPMDTAAMKLNVYDDILYIGTMNFRFGASLYASTDEEGDEFEIVFSEGNGNQNNAYVWYMQPFNGRLYVGTFKTFGEFDLFSSVAPKTKRWDTETNTAFDNEYHYGIRTMAEFEGKLMIGSATARQGESCKVFEATALDTVWSELEKYD